MPRPSTFRTPGFAGRGRRALVEPERRVRETRYRLVAGVAELLASADAVLAATGQRIRACPRYGASRQKAA
jgi:hypothetical protein